MRSMDEASRSPVAPDPRREVRMQRQMERQMGGIRWNLDKWAKSRAAVKEYCRCRTPDATRARHRTTKRICPPTPSPPTGRASWWRIPAYQPK